MRRLTTAIQQRKPALSPTPQTLSLSQHPRPVTFGLSAKLSAFLVSLSVAGLAQGQTQTLPAGAVFPSQVHVQAIEQQLQQARTARRLEATTPPSTEPARPCRNGDMVRRPDGRMEFIKEDCSTASRNQR